MSTTPTPFTSAQQAYLSVLLGETPSLNSYGGKAGGTFDNRVALQTLINDTSARGGGIVRIPRGVWGLGDYITVPSNIIILGFGVASQLQRISGATLTAGKGLLTLSGSNIGCDNFLIDGNTLTSASVNYSSLQPLGSGTPDDNTFIQNSSVVVSPGSSNIEFNRFGVQHTGGYAIFIDVRTASSSDIRIRRGYFKNNRPYTFTDGSVTGGSWFGGVYVSASCTISFPYFVSDLSISDSKWSRNSGNCVWSHSNGFYVNHQGLRIVNSIFEDCGLDAVEYGNIQGGGVVGCTFRRIGYLSTSDSSSSVPAYVPGKGSVAIDTTGFASDIAHANNTMSSINGYGYNLDGMRDSTITGGTISVPLSTDPNYTSDMVSLYGVLISSVLTQVTKGIETGNTSQNGGARRIYMSGISIRNCNEISISLANAKYCHVSGCPIVSTSVLTPPIVITGQSGGTGDELVAYGNMIVRNPINYNVAAPSIVESPNPAVGLVHSNIWKDNDLLA